MAEHSSIEWTDATWNPITGCSVLSPGCTNCYAMKLAGGRLRGHPSRAGLTQDSKAGPVWTGEVRLNEAWLSEPLRWRRPRRIFVCAHGDLFHESVPDAWIDQVMAVMAGAQQHTFQVLTKRSARMRAYFEALPRRLEQLLFVIVDHPTGKQAAIGLVDVGLYRRLVLGDAERLALIERLAKPLPNLWLGVSAEDQARADERLPDLLATPAAVHYVSYEPALGPLDIKWALSQPLDIAAGFLERGHFSPGLETLRPLDWVIAGGESGPGARPMHPDWAAQMRDDCAAAGVAFFFKQWGSWAAHEPYAGGDLGRDVRAGTVRIVHPSGRSDAEVFTDTSGRSTEPGSRYMRLVGKKQAGRLLAGAFHDAMPERRL